VDYLAYSLLPSFPLWLVAFSAIVILFVAVVLWICGGDESIKQGVKQGGPYEPLPTNDFETLRLIGKTTAKSGVFDVLEPGNDMVGAPMESNIIWMKGWNMKVWMQHISGPPLTVAFPYARNGNDYELRNADRLTTSADDSVKGPLLFRNYTGAEAVWLVYSGADKRKPSEVAFVIQCYEGEPMGLPR
jgi:hypothetical protein